jgi:uncharacterized repeat protein (TIGR03803 family)
MKGGAWVENVLYRFQGGNDGAGPFGGIVEKDGLLYGTTQGGGAFGNGTVFQLTPPTIPGGKWTKTVLYSFQGGSDGVNPQGGLLAGRDDGALYGTTDGGGNSYGTVFKLTPPTNPGAKWTETVLVNFSGGLNGGYPLGTLIAGKSGALYGTTEQGGAYSQGTVFEVSPPVPGSMRWTQKILYNFQGGSDAGGPFGGLIADSGALYGTGNHGGTSNFGAVFKLTPPAARGGAWTEIVLYSFKAGSDGYSPVGSLFRLNSTLYGTTAFGGGGSGCAGGLGCGTVFEIMP